MAFLESGWYILSSLLDRALCVSSTRPRPAAFSTASPRPDGHSVQNTTGMLHEHSTSDAGGKTGPTCRLPATWSSALPSTAKHVIPGIGFTIHLRYLMDPWEKFDNRHPHAYDLDSIPCIHVKAESSAKKGTYLTQCTQCEGTATPSVRHTGRRSERPHENTITCAATQNGRIASQRRKPSAFSLQLRLSALSFCMCL